MENLKESNRINQTVPGNGSGQSISPALFKRTLLVIATIILCNISFAQLNERYHELIEDAENLSEKGKYYKSGQKYSEAFIISENNPLSFVDRYRAAKAWIRAGETDSAFVQLFIFSHEIFSKETINNATILGLYSYYDHILSDTNLRSLHTDGRWDEVLETMKKNKEKVDDRLDMGMVLLLEPIFEEDQACRGLAMKAEEEFGRNSEEWLLAFKIMREKDSIHLVIVENILNERGWPGPEVIGYTGNLCLWLVIQHSDKETQEKYIQMMRDAVEKGNARSDELALLEDRLALRQGRKQIYGSQLGYDPEKGKTTYVSPLIDPDNVDIRRAGVGLNTLQEYLSENYGMNWNAKRYKKKLPEIEEIDERLKAFIEP